MQLGVWLAQRMQERQMSQRQLAETSGLTQQAISNYLRGKSKPNYDAIVALAVALQVPPGAFFEATHTEASLLPTPASPTKLSFRAVPTRQVKTFVIGHWLPMQQPIPPIQAHRAGILSNFYTLIFSQLVEDIPVGQRRAGLATEWKAMRDRWLFRLRQGVRFHDGKALMAEDVRWSYQRYLEMNPQERWIQGIQILDSNTLMMHLSAPCRLQDIAMPFILPEGTEDIPDVWVGTGPFQPMELGAGFWRLRANPHYFFSPPFFEEVQIREYPDPEALEEAFREGQVHFAMGVYCPGKDAIATAEPVAQRYQLNFRMTQPLVQRHALRQAIALGLDRVALAKAAGLRTPLYSSGPFDYVLNDRLETPPPSNSQEAYQLLEQIPELADTEFRVGVYRVDPRDLPVAEAIVDQLKHLGIRATVAHLPEDELAHAVLMIFNAQVAELEYGIWTASHHRNLSEYHNPRVDQRIRQLQQAATPPSDSDLFQLRRLIQQDIPDIPLFYLQTPLTYVRRLGALGPRVFLMSGLNEIHTWYLEQGSEVLEGEADAR